MEVKCQWLPWTTWTSMIFIQIEIMRWRSLVFHLLGRVLRIFLITAAVLNLLLLLQLGLPEAAREKHDLSPTFLSFLSKMFPISPSTTLSAPFDGPKMRVFAPTTLGQASQVKVGLSQEHLPLPLLHLLLLPLLSGAEPLHYCPSWLTAATTDWIDQSERAAANPPMGAGATSTMHLVSTSPRLQKIQQSQKYQNTNISWTEYQYHASVLFKCL